MKLYSFEFVNILGGGLLNNPALFSFIFSSNDKIKELKANKEVVALFESMMPGVMNNPMLGMVGGMKLKDVMRMAGDQVPAGLLNKLDVALQKIKKEHINIYN